MVEKCQNLRNEIKTRWGDSVNLAAGLCLLARNHRGDMLRRVAALEVRRLLQSEAADIGAFAVLDCFRDT